MFIRILFIAIQQFIFLFLSLNLPHQKTSFFAFWFFVCFLNQGVLSVHQAEVGGAVVARGLTREYSALGNFCWSGYREEGQPSHFWDTWGAVFSS